MTDVMVLYHCKARASKFPMAVASTVDDAPPRFGRQNPEVWLGILLHQAVLLVGLREDARDPAIQGSDALQFILHLAERDVLSALELDQVLLAVDNPQHPVRVKRADI